VYDAIVTSDEAIEALSDLAAHAGVEVRVEPFESALAGKGGLCRIDGRPVILVDAQLGSLEQAGVVGVALGSFLGHATREIPVPAGLTSYLTTGHGPIRPLARSKPRTLLRLVK